jgi:hypothetical protein
MTDTNFDSVFKYGKKGFAEPWSHQWVHLDEEANGYWIIYMGRDDDAIVITEGEGEIFRLLDDEHKAKVIAYWKDTRKPLKDWETKDRTYSTNLPFQSYEWD